MVHPSVRERLKRYLPRFEDFGKSLIFEVWLLLVKPRRGDLPLERTAHELQAVRLEQMIDRGRSKFGHNVTEEIRIRRKRH